MKSANKFVIALLFLSIAQGAFPAHGKKSYCHKPRALYCATMSGLVLTALTVVFLGQIDSGTPALPLEAKLGPLSSAVASGGIRSALQANSSLSMHDIAHWYELGEGEAITLKMIQEGATRDGSLDVSLLELNLQKHILAVQVCEQLDYAIKRAQLLEKQALIYREHKLTMTPMQQQKAQALFRHIKRDYLESMRKYGEFFATYCRLIRPEAGHDDMENEFFAYAAREGLDSHPLFTFDRFGCVAAPGLRQVRAVAGLEMMVSEATRLMLL